MFYPSEQPRTVLSKFTQNCCDNEKCKMRCTQVFMCIMYMTKTLLERLLYKRDKSHEFNASIKWVGIWMNIVS